ncbi:MAG: MFS transporter [Actinomycetota bacterium]
MIDYKIPASEDLARREEVRHSLLWGLGLAALVILGIIVGSRRFRDFDPALVPYAGATILAAFGLGYRHNMWLRRPPTRLYWLRGGQYFLRPRNLLRNLLRLPVLLWDNLILQRFIERRSRLRWMAHWLIAWGCILAAAVTFPLSWGWVRFETARDSQEMYETYAFGMRLLTFPLDSPVAPLIFNVLNISAFMVIAGVFLALWRRAADRGAMAVQHFTNDFMPLILLFSVSITGVLLTVSTHFLQGQQYGFLSQFHAVTVILTLLYLPFGKFFHIFQRPVQFAIAYYKEESRVSGPARCAGCGGEFASQLHVQDLKQVEAELGIRYGFSGGIHYQDICPPCRRKNLALVQDGLWRAARRTESDAWAGNGQWGVSLSPADHPVSAPHALTGSISEEHPRDGAMAKDEGN